MIIALKLTFAVLQAIIFSFYTISIKFCCQFVLLRSSRCYISLKITAVSERFNGELRIHFRIKYDDEFYGRVTTNFMAD